MEGKEIIINIKLTGDGAIDIKNLNKPFLNLPKRQKKA